MSNTDTITVTDDAIEITLADLTPPTTRPCACGWTVVIPGRADLRGRPKAHRDAAEYDEQTDSTYVSIPCDRQTKGVFAPGHDARLKGLAQTAALLGGDLMRDGLSVGPRQLLAHLAPNLVRYVDEAIERAVLEAQAQAAKEAAKAAKAEVKPTPEATPAPAPEPKPTPKRRSSAKAKPAA